MKETLGQSQDHYEGDDTYEQSFRTFRGIKQKYINLYGKSKPQTVLQYKMNLLIN